MPGIYFHIPFCKQACHYCNFHFSTSLKYKSQVVEAMLKELHWRAGYLPQEPLQSLYFGGGTPSLLEAEELAAFFDAVARHFELAPDAEITLEANPDDLTPEKLQALRASPVNRLSIGIQSFYEEDLTFFNRAHNAAEARQCVERARAAGFRDLTVDLIYGAPTMPDAHWAANLKAVLEAEVPHFSAYALTVEPQTALDYFVRKGKVPPVEEAAAARHFEMLVEMTSAAGYEQYEVSNFALPGRYALHNSSYWKGEPYLGIGPSAHSFNGHSRQWNVANNAKYLKAMATSDLGQAIGLGLFEKEGLSTADQYNEYVMTGLRTIWGVSLHTIRSRFGVEYAAHFEREVARFEAAGQVVSAHGKYWLPGTHRFMADGIAADLFW
ncbi:MAG: radical SAM family heme chaperone HemW [Phaeodactylibacter xiamenensis]|uniref:Heme chaperone HemW n=1 Tax=Phaeodactylibacter xiamenensis TaxID=1524460 RepID=A0A098SA48_9BACT|nr:radical SAM family heme chaperone HemW [Phaeodactylibacter xiamenensis]KGE89000.1 coproporphyrinogen III oxidase [Phaeodactylibacter xiamenensis]MCR9052356.1 radical SAM family heme chaperone HemW [bacterium]